MRTTCEYGDHYGPANEKQVKAINNIVTTLLRNNYEIKELVISDDFFGFDGSLGVTFTRGLPHDEGTAAVIFGRDTYLFNVGRRGGVWQYVDNKRNGGFHRAYRKSPHQLERLDL